MSRRSSNRKLVYICDDQREMIDLFKRNNEKNFDIEAFTTIRELKTRALEQKPDLILMDLFWKKEQASLDITREADDQLHAFQRGLKDLREAIYKAYLPLGITGLAAIRKTHGIKDIPVMVYSRTGQLLLSSEDVHAVVEANAEWLPKDQDNVTPDIESLWMESFIERQARSTPAIRDRINKKWLLIAVALLFVSNSLLLYGVLDSKGPDDWSRTLPIISGVVSIIYMFAMVTVAILNFTKK